MEHPKYGHSQTNQMLKLRFKAEIKERDHEEYMDYFGEVDNEENARFYNFVSNLMARKFTFIITGGVSSAIPELGDKYAFERVPISGNLIHVYTELIPVVKRCLIGENGVAQCEWPRGSNITRKFYLSMEDERVVVLCFLENH